MEWEKYLKVQRFSVWWSGKHAAKYLTCAHVAHRHVRLRVQITRAYRSCHNHNGLFSIVKRSHIMHLRKELIMLAEKKHFIAHRSETNIFSANSTTCRSASLPLLAEMKRTLKSTWLFHWSLVPSSVIFRVWFQLDYPTGFLWRLFPSLLFLLFLSCDVTKKPSKKFCLLQVWYTYMFKNAMR